MIYNRHTLLTENEKPTLEDFEYLSDSNKVDLFLHGDISFDQNTNNSYVIHNHNHCIKSAHIRNFSGPNAEKYRPEKLRIQTFFRQWIFLMQTGRFLDSL